RPALYGDQLQVRDEVGESLCGGFVRQDPVLRTVYDEHRHVDLRQVGAKVGQPGADTGIGGVRRGACGDIEARLPRLLADPVRCELVDVVEVVEEVLEVGVT